MFFAWDELRIAHVGRTRIDLSASGIHGDVDLVDIRQIDSIT